MAQELNSKEAMTAIESGQAVLVDVRTPAEFEEIRASAAINLPLDRLTKDAVLPIAQGKKILFICRSGKRGEQAVSMATSWGIESQNVTGGTIAWEAAGCDVVRGNVTVISLERQVRIAAGALVALGTILGLLGLSWAYGIPLFVGCGLVFAGVTDTCGMAMLLGRMPWNRGSGAQCSR